MDTLWKNLEKELTCAICLQLFEEPLELPCMHNFCQECISRAWAESVGAKRCPECNRTYNRDPYVAENAKLSSIVQRFKDLEAPMEDCRNGMRQAFMVQQQRIGEQIQAIAENLRMAEANKRQAEKNFQKVRETIKLRYQRMQELLMQDMGRTLEMLDAAHSRCEDRSAQIGTKRAQKRKFSMAFSETSMGPVRKQQCTAQGSVGPRSTARLRFAPGPSPPLGPALAPNQAPPLALDQALPLGPVLSRSPPLEPANPLCPDQALPLGPAQSQSPPLEPAPPLGPDQALPLGPAQSRSPPLEPAPPLGPALGPGRAPFLDPTLAPERRSGPWLRSAPGSRSTPGPISALGPSSTPGPSSATGPNSGL